MTKKKLLRNIALLLLPILLYYCVFLAYEPNNYFGLRKATPSGAVFGVLRQYQRNPKSTIILGDSRLAHIDMDIVEDAMGRPVANLAYMGASLQEELDLLKWQLEAHGDTIDEVIFGLSFYTLNKNYNANRMETIRQSMDNPFLYLTNLSYNLEALQNAAGDWSYRLGRLTGRETAPYIMGGGENETQDPATYDWKTYTIPATGEEALVRDKVYTHLVNMDSYLREWELNEPALEELLLLIQHCDEAGIRFVVLLPPMYPALEELALAPYGITQRMQPVLEQLTASTATLLDYEFTTPPNYPEDYYYDTLHLDYQRGMPVWVAEAFTTIGALE